MYHTGVIPVARFRRKTAMRFPNFTTFILVFFFLIFFSYNMNLYVLFAIFWFIFFFSNYFYFHIDIVYECIVLRCIVENKLNYLLTY